MISETPLNRIANAEITPAMIEAGEDVILGVVGGADLGGLFSASDLAERVFSAMSRARQINANRAAYAKCSKSPIGGKHR